MTDFQSPSYPIRPEAWKIRKDYQVPMSFPGGVGEVGNRLPFAVDGTKIKSVPAPTEAYALNNPDISNVQRVMMINPSKKIEFVSFAPLLVNQPQNPSGGRPVVTMLSNANSQAEIAWKNYISELSNLLAGQPASLSAYSYQNAEPGSGIRFLSRSAKEFIENWRWYGHWQTPDINATPGSTLNGSYGLQITHQLAGLVRGTKQVWTPHPIAGVFVGYAATRSIPQKNLDLDDIPPHELVPYASVTPTFALPFPIPKAFLELGDALESEKIRMDSASVEDTVGSIIKLPRSKYVDADGFRCTAGISAALVEAFEDIIPSEISLEFEGPYSTFGRLSRDVDIIDLISGPSLRANTSRVMESVLSRSTTPTAATPVSIVKRPAKIAYNVILHRVISVSPLIPIGMIAHDRNKFSTPCASTVLETTNNIESYAGFSGLCDIDITRKLYMAGL